MVETLNNTAFVQNIENLKIETITAVENFLQNSIAQDSRSLSTDDLETKLTTDYFTSMIQELNKEVDRKCGITQVEIDGPTPLGQLTGKKSKITVRDARKSNGTKLEDVAESWMEAMAAQARGVASLLDMNESQDLTKNLNINLVIKENIVETFIVYCERLRSAPSAKERKKIVTEFNQELVEVLKDNGVIIGAQNLAGMKDERIIKIMGDARDFCNLGEVSQNHQVTILNDSSVKGDFLWASMKMNPLSEKLKYEYIKVKDYRDNPNIGIKQTPQWFQNLKPHQQKLTLKYLEQIMDGDHALPTQLRFLPGLKNAFVDVKGPIVDNKVSNESYAECHSGTLVHNAGGENSEEARRITDLNMQHAKDIIGNEKTMVLSVLNTNSIFQPGERNICTMSKGIAKKIGGVEYHQNGINIVSLNPNASLKRIEEFSVETNKSGQEKKVLWTACKSGKDRTFAILMRNVTKIFGGDNQKDFIKKLSESGHAEVMASGAGATRGAYGLKLKEMFYRMKDKILGSIRDRLTNSISGINAMHPINLEGQSIYKNIVSHILSNNINNASNANTSNEALALRNVSQSKLLTPSKTPSNAAVSTKDSSRSQ